MGDQCQHPEGMWNHDSVSKPDELQRGFRDLEDREGEGAAHLLDLFHHLNIHDHIMIIRNSSYGPS